MTPNPRRLAALAFLVVVSLAALGGCAGAVDASPKGVVEQALRHVEDKDTGALTVLACEARKGDIAERFDLTGGLGGALPIDIDTDALLDTIEIDASKVIATEKSVDGDAAVVSLAGSIGITVDEDAFKEVMREFAESQGIEVDEAQLNTMLLMLGSFTEAIPLNLDVALVREAGAWKICG
jgi:hypothetical protein